MLAVVTGRRIDDIFGFLVCFALGSAVASDWYGGSSRTHG
jgi:hypothetical protein